jgi:drug/metabolite transporter (DMT)-like permease
MYVVSDVVLETIPPFTLLTSRLVLGILTLGIVLARQKVAVEWSKMRPILLTGFIGYGISLGLQFVGTKLSTAANGALITSATPAFVALFAVWLLGEKMTFRSVIPLVAATLGVLLVVDPRTAQFAPQTFLGNLALLGAGLTWGLYSVMVRRDARQGISVSVMTFVVLFGGLPLSIPMGAWEMQQLGIGKLTPGILLGVLYLGIISTAGAMFLWNYAFARLRASTAALAFFAQPVVGAGLSALLLGEQLNSLFYIGGGLILLGVWLANTRYAKGP